MLGKLIKHELRAMLSKSALVAVIFLIVSVIIRIMTFFEDAMENSLSFMMSFAFITVIFIMGLAGLNFYALFSSVSRFQKNLFGDEGYLMHTLPVPSYYHIITKFIAGLVTWILANIVSLISITIAFLGVSEITGMVKMISEMLSFIAKYPFQCFMAFITSASAYCALIFLCYLCTSITNFVPKGKEAVNVLLIIGAIIVNNIIMAIITEFISNSSISSEITATSLIYTVYFAIVAVVFFFITNRIISRNLNLE